MLFPSHFGILVLLSQGGGGQHAVRIVLVISKPDIMAPGPSSVVSNRSAERAPVPAHR